MACLEGILLPELIRIFQVEATSEPWLARTRRPDVVDPTDAKAPQRFVAKPADADAMAGTCENAGNRGLLRLEAVQHGVGEYVKGIANSRGIDSVFSIRKRFGKGMTHTISFRRGI
ncbi:MAG: hypothetical protein OXI87_10505 [Albidovulum sp.]|nr:hypothetical protein [Albidovulum sp.]